MIDVRCTHCKKLLYKKLEGFTLIIKHGKLKVKTSGKTVITCPNCLAENIINENSEQK